MHINSVKDYKCIIIHEVQKIVYSIFTINLLLKCENLKPAKLCVVWWYFNSKQCMVFDHVDECFINLLLVTSCFIAEVPEACSFKFISYRFISAAF